MDVNCCVILEGKATIEQMGKVIYDGTLRVASGEKSKSELLGLGDYEFVPWTQGHKVLAIKSAGELKR